MSTDTDAPIMLAYDTPRGRAWYIGGSSAGGREARYDLNGHTYTQRAILALLAGQMRRIERVVTLNNT